MQEAFSGSSQSSAEAAIGSSQKALQHLDEAIALLDQSITDLSAYSGDVLGGQAMGPGLLPLSPSPPQRKAPDTVSSTDHGPRTSDVVSPQATNIANHALGRFDEGALDHHVRGVPAEQLDRYVDDVLEGRVDVESKYDADTGRGAHWDPDKEAIVIENGDAGTVFTPREGRTYYDDIW